MAIDAPWYVKNTTIRRDIKLPFDTLTACHLHYNRKRHTDILAQDWQHKGVCNKTRECFYVCYALTYALKRVKISPRPLFLCFSDFSSCELFQALNFNQPFICSSLTGPVRFFSSQPKTYSDPKRYNFTENFM